ncbi:beta-glucosidase BglX [Balneola sp. MJW-20]|uniref:beta-glucosidase BglX n=1 Tax=Gracilimonas aurantiaca TaxID=3234185 RepID=UPI003465B368
MFYNILKTLLSVTFLFVLSLQSSQAQTQLIYPEIEEKVDSLLKIMTLEEKVGQLNLHTGTWDITGPKPEGNAAERYKLLSNGGVGAMLNVVGAEATLNAQQIAVENSRLGIPLMFGYDVIHGYKTIFPVPIAEVASWDLKAAETSARIAAIEAAAAGVNWTFAPMIDVSRDARWGRIVESGSEDPFLISEMTRARVAGFQTEDLSANNTIAATAKHFAAYGFAEAGRDYNTIDVSKNTLHNMILPPFKAATDAGAATVMSAFNDIWGIPATAHDYLQNDILKNEWGFNGFIVTDWGTIRQLVPHGYSPNLRTGSKDAIIAGTDMDMESEGFQRHLADLVNNGEVDIEIVNNAVRRILRVKYLLGLFEDPYRYSDAEREENTLYTDEHRAAARDVARKSMVLMENRTNLLPLSKEVNSIAVIGTLADDKDSPIGTWRAQGEANSAVSLLEGIQNAVSKETEVHYAEGYTLAEGRKNFVSELNFPEDDGSGIEEAVEIAGNADIVIMALGEEGFQSGEGRSQVDISLKGRQLELFKKVMEVNPNVVVVLMNGRPIAEPELYENAPSLLEAWHLGSEAGNAIADVLFGDYNPSGKLPVSVPRHVGQVPIYYNHKNTGRPVPQQGDAGTVFWSHYTDESNDPQYPFGYGLSYTSFEYSDLRLSKPSMAMEEEITVSVNVTNTGERAGEEVVQFYIRDHFASTVRPVKELKGFRKISLDPGEKKSVSFTVNSNTLGFFGADEIFKAEAGIFSLMIGGNSTDLLSTEFELTE